MHWLLDPASYQGVAMQRDWYIFIGAGAFVGLYVYGCIAWCLIAYRARPKRQPARFENNPPLELTYAAIPVVIVIGLFLLTYFVEMPIDRVAGGAVDPVHVVAFRWSWRFEYEGTPIAMQGTPLQPPTLYLPVNRITRIDLNTADVNHSFWVPAFLFKRDAIPGMTNVFDVTPNRLGTFPARCANFCGLEHALMSFKVKVVPDAAYDRFIATNGAQLP
ncbi:MAG: cytochrome c oxidase subunit II [Candidatus Eremiobacteraeota bacterium]|nr:cytochrome c oxidase subunit II [Candidatus Eremiobacteraeota bacterium]